MFPVTAQFRCAYFFSWNSFLINSYSSFLTTVCHWANFLLTKTFQFTHMSQTIKFLHRGEHKWTLSWKKKHFVLKSFVPTILTETKAINPMSQYEFGIKCCSFSGPSIPNFLVVVLGGLLAAAIESFGLRLGNGWLLNLCLPHYRRETYHWANSALNPILILYTFVSSFLHLQ